MKNLPTTPSAAKLPRGQSGASIFMDECHPARTKQNNPALFHPVKALLELIASSHGWVATHHGIRHDEAHLSLETWNGWLTCDFTVDSEERFPLSIWERFRIARAARKLSHQLIMKSGFPDGSSRTLNATVMESIFLNPQEWEVCTDVVHHQASGLELVTRDGPFFLRCSPMSRVHYRIGLIQRLPLWLGIKRLIRRTVAGRLYHAAATLRRQSTVSPS